MSDSEEFESADEGEANKSTAGARKERSQKLTLKSDSDLVISGAKTVVEAVPQSTSLAVVVCAANVGVDKEDTLTESDTTETYSPTSSENGSESSDSVPEQPVAAVTTAVGKQTAVSGGDGPCEPTQDVECAKNILDRLSQATERNERQKAAAVDGSWGSWGRWSSSILSTAVSSVSSFTGQVGEGFHAVLETFDSSAGEPTAGEGAPTASAGSSDSSAQPAGQESMQGETNSTRSVETSGQQQDDAHLPTSTHESSLASSIPNVTVVAAGDAGKHGETGGRSDWFSQWGVQELTASVQSHTKSLMSSGLDVLESIGKKTVAVLAESDPGLKKTKLLFHSTTQKPNLSQLLREAKEKGDRHQATACSSPENTAATYGLLFDDFQGLAHLEALEMLSQGCQAEISSMEGKMSGWQVSSPDAAKIMCKLKDTFSVEDITLDSEEPEEHTFNEIVNDCVEKLHLPLTAGKLLQVQARGREGAEQFKQEYANGLPADAAQKVHDGALRALAELTARSLELYHKFGELLLLRRETVDAADDSNYDYELMADEMARMTRTVCHEVTIVSARYTDCLDLMNDARATSHITSVFVEATNSSTYIQDGFRLLLPVVLKSFFHSQASSQK